MRKLYAFLLTAFVLIVTAANQASAQNYTMTTSAGNAIVPGTTLVPGSQGDDVTASVALPFTYNAYNNPYNTLIVSSNGNIQFTTNNSAFGNTCPLPNAAMGVAFHPHWDDLWTLQAGGGVFTSISGVAPNRIFNIEWRAQYFPGVGTVSFEARLFEGLQRVDFIYGQVDNLGSSASIGVQNSGAALQTTYSCNASSLSVGLGVSFTLSSPCSGVPSPGFITGPSALMCTGTPVTLTLNGYTTGGGITIQWKSSPTPGGPYAPIPGATNPTYSFNANAQAYFVATVTCVPSGFSATTSEFTLNVDKPIHTVTAATPPITCSPGSSVLTATAANGILPTSILVSSGTINLAIPDNTPAGVNSTIVAPAYTFPAAGNLKIRINCTHTWVGDLVFRLTSPCGVTYLFDRPGVPPGVFGNSDDLVGVYIFDLAGATVIPETPGGSGFVPTGTYKPSDANGVAHNWAGLSFPCSAAGNWTLNVADLAGGDIGTLIDWAIMRPGIYTHSLVGPGTITQNPPTGSFNENASFNVTNIPAGNQNFTLTSTDGIGCSVSSNIPVTVNLTPTITITPPSATICNGAIQPLTASVSPGGNNYAITTSTGNSIVPGTTLVPGSQGDDVTASVALPFTYTAYNNNFNSLLVCSNGNIQFTTNNTAFSNVCPLPAAALGIAFHPHWDDMWTLQAGGGVFTSISGVAPNRIFNIEWRAQYFPGIGSASFEARLYEGQQRVDFIYGAVSNSGVSASIGVQNAAAGLQATYSCNTASLSSGLGITFTIPTIPVTFSPLTELYTDPGATVAYTGTPVNTIYAKPTVTRTYFATYTSAQLCSGTTSVTITVNQLPAITSQPAPLAAPICPGFNVTYTVGATGAGLTYQWQVSTDNGVTWNNVVNGLQYSGVTTFSLTIINVQTSQNGYQYRCIVSGTCPPPVTSNAVTLVVATAPVINSITTSPAVPTICVNSNISFTVNTTGVPAPTIFQWQVSTDNGVTWTNLTTGGSYTATFTITGAVIGMNGYRYRVIVTNYCNQSVTSASVTLTVNPLPVVSATPITNRVCLSDTLVPLVGTPVGGTWSGVGVSGFYFVPTATAVGVYTLTYTYTSNLNCTASASITVKVEDCPERIRLLRNDGVILYPNPNNGRFNIRINSTLYNVLGMRVFTPAGQLLKFQIFGGLVYGRVIPIDLHALPSGTYIVKFYYDDGIRTSEKNFSVVIGR